MDTNQHSRDGQAQDMWVSVVSASMAAKLRLAAAGEEFCAYQGDLGRRTAPLIRRIM